MAHKLTIITFISAPPGSRFCYYAQMGTLVKWVFLLAMVGGGGTLGALHHAQIWSFIIDITHAINWDDVPKDDASALAWPG